MNPAILYHPEAYTTTGPKLMGRNAAGESFLKALLSYSSYSELWVQVFQNKYVAPFAELARSMGRQEPVYGVTNANLGQLAKAGLLFTPGPGLNEHAFHRTVFGDAAWSLCGITHTTSSLRVMDALAQFPVAPIQAWDALICTSKAVQDNVRRVVEAQLNLLHHRFDIKKYTLPQFPVIPLGVHANDFKLTPEDRAESRRSLGVSEDTTVVTFTGRLSFNAKAHPLAMYQALEIAAQKTGKPVVLIECSWFANEHIQRAFEAASALACPSVRVLRLDGRDPVQRKHGWAGADVFCSLSDNIQEAFGLTPIEAMAAGLPLVVSDWDGYKDTVRDGIDGFRVPTWMPAPGTALDLAWRHAHEIDSYDMYCGHTCSLVAVDVPATANAFIKLIEDPALRRRMGESARQRALEVYDWSKIIPQYMNLWGKLNDIRLTQGGQAKRLANPWPARMDPFTAFASYPTGSISAETVLGLVDESSAAALSRANALLGLAMVNFAKVVLPSAAQVEWVLKAFEHGPKSVGQALLGLPEAERVAVLRQLHWFVKMNLLKLY
ncbi:MAG: glycosyltransferase family 4 protein [Limnobacter sp.]|uniref:glycosyltransferase family 4 protein n=1 Tax=Limnobacter sp. TaxID=2003368 RepID=UPI00391C3D78